MMGMVGAANLPTKWRNVSFMSIKALGGGGVSVAAASQVSRRMMSFSPVLLQTAGGSTVKGQIAQKTPTRIVCEAGKTYNWCACGLSSKQPLCDGSHKRSTLGLTPIQFTAQTTKEYIFCNCKQTNKRPFCDGSHKKL